jgi:OOP family OmpA-OmpF porin
MHERLSLVLLSGSLAAGALLAHAPAWSADTPALKETLGKVQSGAESKAVDDLIEKLRGGARKATPPPVPAAAPGTPATPAATPAPASAPVSTERSAAETSPAPNTKPAPAAVAAPAPPPAIKADQTVEVIQAPSIDLEIFFAYKSAEITPQAAAALTPLGRALSDARLAGNSFLIAGHTDAKGGDEYNLALSQERADAVRQHLIASLGLDGARLVAKGMGSRQLKVPGQPLAAENRRVQIVNLSTGQQR